MLIGSTRRKKEEVKMVEIKVDFLRVHNGARSRRRWQLAVTGSVRGGIMKSVAESVAAGNIWSVREREV